MSEPQSVESTARNPTLMFVAVVLVEVAVLIALWTFGRYFGT